jgi:hypothetical protein
MPHNGNISRLRLDRRRLIMALREYQYGKGVLSNAERLVLISNIRARIATLELRIKEVIDA